MDFKTFNHFSYTSDLSEIRPATASIGSWKPTGALWFCRNTEWPDWCIGAGMGGDHEYRYPIKDIDTDNILIVPDGINGIKQFFTDYGLSYPCMTMINWKKIAETYEGVYLPAPNHVTKGHILDDVSGMTYSLFLGLDVDSLAILTPKSIKLDQYEFKKGGFVQYDSDDDV